MHSEALECGDSLITGRVWPGTCLRVARKQGRVWSGRDAIGAGLVDALGGLARAVAILKERAGIAAGDQVRACRKDRRSRVLCRQCSLRHAVCLSGHPPTPQALLAGHEPTRHVRVAGC